MLSIAIDSLFLFDSCENKKLTVKNEKNTQNNNFMFLIYLLQLTFMDIPPAFQSATVDATPTETAPTTPPGM